MCRAVFCLCLIWLWKNRPDCRWNVRLLAKSTEINIRCGSALSTASVRPGPEPCWWCRHQLSWPHARQGVFLEDSLTSALLKAKRECVSAPPWPSSRQPCSGQCVCCALWRNRGARLPACIAGCGREAPSRRRCRSLLLDCQRPDDILLPTSACPASAWAGVWSLCVISVCVCVCVRGWVGAPDTSCIALG